MIHVSTEHDKGNPLKEEVEEDLRRFDAWFQEMGNDPLVNSEKAILSTFFYWKTQIDQPKG